MGVINGTMAVIVVLLNVFLLTIETHPKCKVHCSMHGYTKLHYLPIGMFALSRKSSGSRRRLCEGLRRCRGNASHDDRKCVPEEFGRVRLGSFFQEQPTISNPFTSDNFLQRCLRALLPEHVS